MVSLLALLMPEGLIQILTSYLFLLQDSATLLAEIVNSCTKATAPPSEVWEKLLHKEGRK